MGDNLYRRSHRIIQMISKKRDKQKTDGLAEEVTKKCDKNEIQLKKRQIVCEKCSSNLAKDVNQKRRHFRPKTCFDPFSQKWIKVCNNCAKIMTRMSDSSAKVSIEEQKLKYLSNCQSFGLSLVQLLNDSSAERLYCPNVKPSGKPCACLQRYVIGTDDNINHKQQRAQNLLDLLTKAKHLSQQKCYSTSNPKTSNPKSGQKIGLGNGHKKSKEFEEFVNIQRNCLKTDLNLCEKAVQRVLFYSNNFLHKKLKTEPNARQRVQRQKGKAVTGKLIDIQSLSEQMCCVDRCVRLSVTHPQLLSQWRQRAATGQLEARRVLAEMLTPTQSVRTNCSNFISLVTGSSHQTINKVKQYLIANGGNREPAEHGLKQFWVFNQKKAVNKKLNSNRNQSESESVQNSANNITDNSCLLRTDTTTIDCFDGNNRVALIVNQTNNEISVINSGKRQTITLLSPRIDLIQNRGQVLQIPVSITSL